MSSYGQYAVDLAALREVERQRAVRSATVATLEACTQALGQVEARWLGPSDADRLEAGIAEARAALSTDVDAASRLAKAVAVTVRRTAQAARAVEMRWSRALSESRAALAALRDDAQAVQDAEVDAAFEVAERACETGDEAAMQRALTGAEATLARVRARLIDEAARRQVAIGLTKALGALGFVQAPATRGPNDKVVLTGRLPSGRTARFEIALDGTIDFDLAGYTGRECGKDLDAVREVLRSRFAAPTEPVQFTWKNPDRLSAGARPIPANRKETA